MKNGFNLGKLIHVWSVLCSDTLIDVDTNNVSMKVIEQLNIPKSIETKISDGKEEKTNEATTFLPINLTLITLWSRKSGSTNEIAFQTRIEQIDPRGKVLNSFQSEARMPSTSRRLRTRVLINGISTTVPGEYTFRVVGVLDDEEFIVAQIPLEVRVNLETANFAFA